MENARTYEEGLKFEATRNLVYGVWSFKNAVELNEYYGRVEEVREE